jgi:hypothetical protein
MTEEDYKKTETQKIQMEFMRSSSIFIGANELKSYFGPEGSNVADFLMNGKEVAEKKQELFLKEKVEAEQMGIGYAPEITNYSLIKNAKKIVNDSMQVLTLGNLEKIAGEIMPGLEKGPEKFKGMNYLELVKKTQEKEEISEDLKDALRYHSVLSRAYEKGGALSLMNASYSNQFNGVIKSLNEKYKPQENSEENSN